jgi:hypothetical protein
MMNFAYIMDNPKLNMGLNEFKVNFILSISLIKYQRSLKASESAVAAGQEGKFWRCIMFYSTTGVPWVLPV